MKKYIPITALMISCLLTIICLYQISNLRNEISVLQSAVNNNLNDVSMSLRNIYSNIDNKLEKQANILSYSDYAYKDVNISDKTATVEYSVIPKEYMPDVTSATLVCNNITYSMTFDQGKYIARIPLPLFEQSSVTSVQFSENGTVRTQQLNDYFTPRYEFLPSVTSHYSGNWQGNYNQGIYSKKYNGDIRINFEQKNGNAQVKSISLLEYIDGKPVWSTDVPKNHTPTPKKTSTFAQETNEQAAIPLDGYSDTSPYYYYLDRVAKIPYGASYELYIEVTDSYGLRHRSLVDFEIIDESGRQIDTVFYRGTQAAIYDTDGNLLAGPDWEAYGVNYEVNEKIEIASGH